MTREAGWLELKLDQIALQKGDGKILAWSKSRRDSPTVAGTLRVA
jgi:hypothetical protein